MWEYFDLNKRALKSRKQFMKVDLHGLTQFQAQPEEPNPLPPPSQIFMYIGVFIGVLFSSLVDQFKQGGNVHLSFTIGQILVSSIIALAIIPIVYEKLSLNPRAPFIVQFGIFVQNGIFWQVAIKAIAVAVNIK